MQEKNNFIHSTYNHEGIIHESNPTHERGIHRALEAYKRTSISAYKKLVKLKGMDCLIRPPVGEKSIFGLEDLVDYDESATYPKRLLLFNIFQESSMGMMEYDAFIECYALTLLHEKLELQTLIDVDFMGRQMSFKVDDHKNIVPAIHGQMFIKNMLVPAT
jgi:hypothetical protein